MTAIVITRLAFLCLLRRGTCIDYAYQLIQSTPYPFVHDGQFQTITNKRGVVSEETGCVLCS